MMEASETKGAKDAHEEVSYMRKIVTRARVLLAEKHDLTHVRIRPVSDQSARFSIPCAVDGIRDGKQVLR